MSKDNRHDGRRRGAGQHRLGPRVSQGGDGRERSGSNSSGSSHGGGKSKNASITALKVRKDVVNSWSTTLNLVKTVEFRCIASYLMLKAFFWQTVLVGKKHLSDRTCRRCDGGSLVVSLDPGMFSFPRVQLLNPPNRFLFLFFTKGW